MLSGTSKHFAHFERDNPQVLFVYFLVLNMHTFVLRWLLSILTVGCFLSLHDARAQTPTSASVSIPTMHDWGTMRLPSSLTLDTEIPIVNVAASGAVQIVEIKPGCGCTKTDPDRTVLQPRDTAHVKIRLNVTTSQTGLIQKNVRIRTAHMGDTTESNMMLQVTLQRALTIGPSLFIPFNDAVVGRVSTSELTFHNASDAVVTIADLVYDQDVTSDLLPNERIEPRATRTVRVSVAPKAPGQLFGGMRFVARGNGDDDSFNLPVYGTVTRVAGK